MYVLVKGDGRSTSSWPTPWGDFINTYLYRPRLPGAEVNAVALARSSSKQISDVGITWEPIIQGELDGQIVGRVSEIFALIFPGQQRIQVRRESPSTRFTNI